MATDPPASHWPQTIARSEIAPEVCHALGVLVINWNWCEWAQAVLLASYMHDPMAIEIVRPIPNATRAHLLSDLAAERETDPAMREAIDHFQKGFSLCLENRNLLVHSTAAPKMFLKGEPMSFHSQGKRIRSAIAVIEADPALLARVAAEIESFFSYGMDIWRRLAQGEGAPSRDRPPLPRKLAEAPPSPKASTRRRESSPASARRPRKP